MCNIVKNAAFPMQNVKNSSLEMSQWAKTLDKISNPIIIFFGSTLCSSAQLSSTANNILPAKNDD